MSVEDDASMIGPALPPGFSTRQVETESLKLSTCSDRHKPQSAGTTIGPALPPGFATATRQSESEDSDSDSSSSSVDEPCAEKVNAPHDSSSSIGPVLPPGFVAQPQHFSSDEDEDSGFGPRPLTQGGEAEAEEEYQKRLMRHRLQQDTDTGVPKRETWMTQLPEVKLAKHMGLTARKLGDGSTVKYEDQSAWTDTPTDRARKQQEALEGVSRKRPHDPEVVQRSARDVELEGIVQEYNKKKRAESLLDMHTKKLHKKHKKEEKKKKKEKKKKEKKNKKEKKKKSEDSPKRTERRPFDRDLDLKANRFDAAQRAALVKRSKELNSKFKAGGQHFL